MKYCANYQKCDTETQSEKMLLQKMAPVNLLNAANLQFVKNAMSAKHNKAKCNKIRSACIKFFVLRQNKLLL